MKVTRSIGPATHGILDYLMVIILVIGPGVAGFAPSTAQAKYCWAIAALLFIVSILTRYPLGAKKIVGFVSHGVVEMVIAIVLIVLPWMRGFAAGVHSRDFFVSIGVLFLVIWALTDFRNLRGRATSSTTPSGTKPSSTTPSSSSTSASTPTSSKTS
jgi:hypothetical protein